MLSGLTKESKKRKEMKENHETLIHKLYTSPLKPDRQTDGTSKSYTGCSLVKGIFTKKISCLPCIAAKNITFLQYGF